MVAVQREGGKNAIHLKVQLHRDTDLPHMLIPNARTIKREFTKYLEADNGEIRVELQTKFNRLVRDQSNNLYTQPQVEGHHPKGTETPDGRKGAGPPPRIVGDKPL